MTEKLLMFLSCILLSAGLIGGVLYLFHLLLTHAW